MLPDYDPEYVDYLFSRIVHDMSEKYIIEIFTKYLIVLLNKSKKQSKKDMKLSALLSSMITLVLPYWMQVSMIVKKELKTL